MILDSGERTVHENGFQRDMHEGKGRMDLLPWRAIIEVSKHCEEGAKKYGERNIDLGCPQHSLIDSAFRHLAKYMIGERDENHLRACAWNIMWALEQDVFRPDMMDIPSRMSKGEKSQLIENVLVEEVEEHEPEKIITKMFEEVERSRRCVEMTCFNNTYGTCQSRDDSWRPELGQDCPEFSED